jgi:putative oxidoreductase
MLGWLFVSAGVDVFRNPGGRADAAGEVLAQVRRVMPALPGDDVTVVRANAVVQTVAGATLGLGKFPRVSALVLACSLVPTTVGGHAFWTVADPVRRGQQRVQFNKNLAMLGGLLLAATWPRGRL